MAVQHKYLLCNERKPEDAPHGSLIQSTIRHFPANVQTEILYLLKKVQTDDSVFAITPVVHPSKQLVMTVQLFTLMVRKTLEVHGRAISFKTPMQMKFYMFMFDKAFVIFKQLFCTANTLENANSNRPLVFILLQISLALQIMQTGRESTMTVC